MTPILVWDTETSNLPLFSSPSSHPGQPHIVQFATLLIDLDTRTTIAGLDLIIKPDGWTISDEAAAIHGITTEHALDVGVPEREVVALFLALGLGCTHVAHNSRFDERIMRIALKRFHDDKTAEDFKEGRQFDCTMQMARRIMPGKTPTLGDAYQFFTGLPLIGAHNAMTDVLACRDIYFAIKDKETVA